MKEHFAFRKYIKDNYDQNTLLTKPFIRKDKLYMSDETEAVTAALQNLESIGKFEVNIQRNSQRWFVGEVNVMLYTTDGADIST